jgi:RDD family
MAYGLTPPVQDPTNVMGLRIGAWIVDFIPAALIVGLFSRHSSTTYTNVAPNFCTVFKQSHNGYVCFMSGNDAYTFQGLRGGAILIWLAYYFVVAGLLQGATGATFGKHLFGLRVVDANGELCGISKAMIRTLVGVFEIGFCFLIGFLTAALSHPHRRLGDLAAGTYVVPQTAVGKPLFGPQPAWTPQTQTAWSPPPAGGQTWGPGTPAPGWGAPPTQAPPSAAPPAWGTPAAQPPPAQTPGTWGTPAPVTPETPTEAPSEDAPGWAAPASTSPASTPAATCEPPAAAEPQAQAHPPAREPQWDEQRHAWVFWEAETSRWLQHDPATGQWGPLR